MDFFGLWIDWTDSPMFVVLPPLESVHTWLLGSSGEGRLVILPAPAALLVVGRVGPLGAASVLVAEAGAESRVGADLEPLVGEERAAALEK